jgi:hypothetical protein
VRALFAIRLFLGLLLGDPSGMLPKLIDAFSQMGLFPENLHADGSLDWDMMSPALEAGGGALAFNEDLLRGYMIFYEAACLGRPPRLKHVLSKYFD